MYVSVIMPTYNRRDYVGNAIKSVLDQHHAEFELIIVDDASTDDTFEAVRNYARQDSRMVIVRHTDNKGLAFTLNEALALAKYPFVARMDDDDIMLSNRIENQLEFLMNNQDVSVVSSWAYLINETGQIIGKSCPECDLERGKAQLKPALFLELIHPATMYRKDDVLAIGGYRERRPLEDRDLWGRLVTGGYKIAVQPEFLMLHRRHGNSIMGNRLDSIFEWGDYIDFNVVRRLQGQGEFTLSEYNNYIASLPLIRRLSNRRSRKSAVTFRRATVFYSKRSWLPFAGNLSLAIALAPVSTIKRVWKKYA
jgi:glycosyltransferase involved in cell wall biosynthesis